MDKMNRKQFLIRSLAGAAGLITGTEAFGQQMMVRKGDVDVGVCTGFENGDIALESGCSFLEEGVGKILMPDKPDTAFNAQLTTLRNANAPGIRSFIYFIPGHLKAVGPEANHDDILSYASTAFARAPKTGARYVVFGSGGSRRIPDGFSHDVARKQFIELCSRLAPEAGKHNMILAVEQLNRGETNFINTLAQAGDVVRAVNHPNFKMVCDIYHALKEEEDPEEVVKFGKDIVHCHIAEKEKRTPPGVMGDDFTPWFRGLKRIRYGGGISLECNWTNFADEIGPTVSTLKKQWRDA
jgi:sugar phosphate isomerase/epimerase